MAVAGLTRVWRLYAFFTQQECKLASRGLGGTGRFYSSVKGGDSATDTEFDFEDDDFEKIKSAIKKQQKTIKFHRIKKEFEPRGAPERALSWNAMEQIRFLKQESPEEWTLPRLAEGFNVSPDVIRRVLRSKFSPPEKRKLKQDLKVSKLLGQVPQDTKKDVLRLQRTTKDSDLQLLPTGINEKQLNMTNKPHLIPPPVKPQTAALALREESSLIEREENNLQVYTHQPQHNMQGIVPVFSEKHVTSHENSVTEPINSYEEEEQEDLDEEWDGEVLSDGELEALAESSTENQMQVVQKGMEFYDDNGNFLYRI
ncbi:neugrin [Pelodytes ibericus]